MRNQKSIKIPRKHAEKRKSVTQISTIGDVIAARQKSMTEWWDPPIKFFVTFGSDGIASIVKVSEEIRQSPMFKEALLVMRREL